MTRFHLPTRRNAAIKFIQGGRVEWTSLEDFVGQQVAGLPVLVPEKRVDKRVACRLAVGQTLGQHSPYVTHNTMSVRRKVRECKATVNMMNCVPAPFALALQRVHDA
ncbi:hypothetical protein EYF80_026445 [Liparis tanakae]|uniref:Uncharacterized protein n=1 Tax=Liparis tanakae TaxID=230148 RepID=A0A4Z2HED0_9TELE|nr:hypothetical protein EYF80_026445 [Liparis tanakae]